MTTIDAPRPPAAPSGPDLDAPPAPTIPSTSTAISAPPRRGARALSAGMCGLLLVHFGITGLYNAPLNPLSQQFAGLTSMWMSPFFDQNWQLFAPDPVSRDTGVLVLGMADGEEIGGYIDLSTPMLERRLHNPLPDNLAYTVSGAAHSLMTSRQDIVTDPTVVDEHPDAADEPLYLSQSVIDSSPLGLQRAYDRSLRTMTSLAVDGVERETGIRPDSVRIRIVTHVFPRWSERADAGIGEIVYSDTPWLSLEGTEVAP
jgi:hypothetical protein